MTSAAEGMHFRPPNPTIETTPVPKKWKRRTAGVVLGTLLAGGGFWGLNSRSTASVGGGDRQPQPPAATGEAFPGNTASPSPSETLVTPERTIGKGPEPVTPTEYPTADKAIVALYDRINDYYAEASDIDPLSDLGTSDPGDQRYMDVFFGDHIAENSDTVEDFVGVYQNIISIGSGDLDKTMTVHLRVVAGTEKVVWNHDNVADVEFVLQQSSNAEDFPGAMWLEEDLDFKTKLRATITKTGGVWTMMSRPIIVESIEK